MSPLKAFADLRLELISGVAVLAIFSGLYGSLWLGKRAAEKDRDAVTTWAANVCATVGVSFRDDPKRPSRVLAKRDWGKACEGAIRKLAKDAAGAAQAALTTVTDHDAEQAARAYTDRPAARRSASRIQSAQQQMEVAIVAAPDGHLGPDYFDGLNHSLGLRPYVETSASKPNGGGRGEGSPVGRPDAVQ